MRLHEIKILSGIHPTDNQKRVLAVILASPSPKEAGEKISGDENMIAARNILMNLGVITVSTAGAELTDKGMQIAQEENICDEGGQLTDVGTALAHEEEPGVQPQPGAMPEMPNEIPNEMPPPPGGPMGLESFSMLRGLLKS